MKRKPKTPKKIDHYSLISEGGFQDSVIELAHWYGWRVAHFHKIKMNGKWFTPVAADGEGFPDLVLARAGKVLFVEMKSEAGTLSPPQREWAASLRTLRIWRPRDMDLIEAELR